MALKCMDNVNDCEITALADHIVRLEICRNIKLNYRGCSSGSLDNVNTTGISMQDSIVNLIVVKVVDKLANLKWHQETGGNKNKRKELYPSFPAAKMLVLQEFQTLN